MDMYQKRKARQEKNIKKQEENNNSQMNINWVMVIYENALESIEIPSFL